MPSSNPKKRKGKKKKKGKSANNHSTPNSQQALRIGDQKRHDGIDSDGGQISQPRSEPDYSQLREVQQPRIVDSQGKSHLAPASVFFLTFNGMEVFIENGNGNGGTKSKLKEVVEVVQDVESVDVEDFQVPSELKPDKNSQIESVEQDAGSSGNYNEESGSGDKDSGARELENMQEGENSGGSVMENVIVDNSTRELVEEKSVDSVTDTVSDVDSTARLEEAEHEKNSDGSFKEASPAIDPAETVESVIEEKNQASAPTVGVDAGVSNEIGSESKDKEEISLPVLTESTEASDLVDSTATKDEERMVQYSDAPNIESRDFGSAELPKEPEIPESSENQPLLQAIPPPVERTSWKSCCGIFDVLRGPDR